MHGQAIEEVNTKLSGSLFRRVLGSKVVTELQPFDGKYWLAEDYHQQYLQKGGQNASKGARLAAGARASTGGFEFLTGWRGLSLSKLCATHLKIFAKLTLLIILALMLNWLLKN